MKVAFVGLGIMGKPMAKNLLKAGHELKVFDIVAASVAEAAGAGAGAASSAAEAAAGAEVTITMLPDGPDVEAAVLGPAGVLEGAAPGSISQVRETAARLVRYAKETATSVFLVGHVTKEGGIAGPRVLEHMVDAVLYFEGDVGSRFRVLRAFKNRFGAVNELGVFAMGERGLREVSNPSAIFLGAHSGPTPGSAVMVTREGTRPLLVEVQALVDASPLANPRRVALGLDGSRMAMLLAVLHRHGGAAVYDQDVFVNVVGGIRVQETAADLPVLLAVYSSFRDRALLDKTVAFGEAGLSGELRPVPNGEERLKEAASHGFERAIVPRANAPKKSHHGALEIIAVERLDQALAACF